MPLKDLVYSVGARHASAFLFRTLICLIVKVALGLRAFEQVLREVLQYAISIGLIEGHYLSQVFMGEFVCEAK